MDFISNYYIPRELVALFVFEMSTRVDLRRKYPMKNTTFHFSAFSPLPKAKLLFLLIFTKYKTIQQHVVLFLTHECAMQVRLY